MGDQRSPTTARPRAMGAPWARNTASGCTRARKPGLSRAPDARENARSISAISCRARAAAAFSAASGEGEGEAPTARAMRPARSTLAGRGGGAALLGQRSVLGQEHVDHVQELGGQDRLDQV